MEDDAAQYPEAIYGTKRTIYNDSHIGGVWVKPYELTHKEKLISNIRKTAGYSIFGCMFLLSLLFAPVIAAMACGVALAFVAINLIEG